MGKPRFTKADGTSVSQMQFEKIDKPPLPHCTKVQYGSKAAAKRGLAQVQSYPKQHPDELRPKYVYHCKRCDHWHLTKQTQRKDSE